MTPATLSDLSAFRIGHAQNQEAATGCTVIVAPQGATCGVDVRGGGPATRETDLLRPENMIEAVHAIVLSGGSAFGLEASCGVMEALAERGIGFRLGTACVPIVVGASLFDLLIGKPVHPDKEMGRAATLAALEGEGSAASLQGNVGAGCGATVGKMLAPQQAMKSGLGISCVKAGDLIVGALVAVNAIGCVRDEQGWIAGCLDGQGGVLDPLAAMMQAAQAAAQAQAAQCPSASDSEAAAPCTNTTLGVVLTNAKLTKAQATKVSSTTHDAYARAIKPVHTSNDGDAIFTFASGEVEATPDTVAILATEVMQQAIVSAVKNAESAYGLVAAKDLQA